MLQQLEYNNLTFIVMLKLLSILQFASVVSAASIGITTDSSEDGQKFFPPVGPAGLLPPCPMPLPPPPPIFGWGDSSKNEAHSDVDYPLVVYPCEMILPPPIYGGIFPFYYDDGKESETTSESTQPLLKAENVLRF